MFYRFVRSVASAGGQVGLEWTPLPGSGEDLAMDTYLGISAPADRGRFLHAMLGLVHLDGADPTAGDTVSAALDAAGDPSVVIEAGKRDELGDLAEGLGVTGVPTLFRHGPAARISLNPAALEGDVLARAAGILAVADDDGVWEVVKP